MKKNLFNPYSVIILIISGIGLYLRIHNLGLAPFWVDEVTSVLAAKGLLSHGIPTLPSGEPYPRDPLSTYMIAASIRILGDTEFAARLPSVILGTLAIPLTYLLAKRIAGKNVGLIAAFFMSFSFFELAWSMQARMYSAFQFFFLLSIIAYTQLKTADNRQQTVSHAVLLLIAATCTYFSHETGVILIFILAIDFLFTFKTRRYVFFLARVMLVTVFSIFLISVIFFKSPLFPGWFFNIFTREITGVSFWGQPGAFLKETYTVLWWLAILGSVFILLRNWHKGLIAVISLWISIFALSYFGIGFASWWPRYLYFIIPFFLILSANGIWVIITMIIEELTRKLPIISSLYSYKILAPICISLFIMFTPFVPDIDLRTDNLQALAEYQPNYRDAAELIKPILAEQDIVITNRTPLVYYYLGKVDYTGTDDFLMEKDGMPVVKDGMLVDFYTGALLIETEQQLKNIVNETERGWVIFNPYLSLTGRGWIEENLSFYEEVTSPGDDQIVYVYSWGIDTSYSEDFSTDKWDKDKYYSYGIDRSLEIIHTAYVLYPTVYDEETYVKYHFEFSGTQNPTTITATGRRRDAEHSLSIWVSPDNVDYHKVIELDTSKVVKQADLSDYIQDNQIWVQFSFYRSSSGENTPRLIDFKIQSIMADINAKISPVN
ncbi:ArnT family glycosyltransferase [Chloroflexota bacterium]